MKREDRHEGEQHIPMTLWPGSNGSQTVSFLYDLNCGATVHTPARVGNEEAVPDTCMRGRTRG